MRFEEKQRELELKALLQKLLIQESRAPEKWIEDIRKLKQEIEAIDEQRYRVALVRARAEDTGAGEAPSKRALGLEKARPERNNIDSVEWGGTLTTHIKDIKTTFEDAIHDAIRDTCGRREQIPHTIPDCFTWFG